MSVTQGDVAVIHRSRWGYHPCDQPTWLKIKRLRFLWFLTLRRMAAWRRWNNKLPQNRVIWRRIRREDGRPIGWEQVGAWPEPAVPEFMVREERGQRVLAHDWIEACYRQARRATTEPQEAWPAARLAEIGELLQRLEAWFADRRRG